MNPLLVIFLSTFILILSSYLFKKYSLHYIYIFPILFVIYIIYKLFYKPEKISKEIIDLFKIIEKDDPKELTMYLEKYKMKVSDISKLKYYSNVTPINYSVSKNKLKIFKFLLENNYDLNYFPPYGEPPIIFIAYNNKYNYMKLLLEHKEKININIKDKKFNANALEIAIWRSDIELIELLLKNGMEFSISKYNQTECGRSLCEFTNVRREVKELLAARKLLQLNKKQFMFREIALEKKINVGLINNLNAGFYENFLKKI